MSFMLTYKPLIIVEFLHHFFLNQAESNYDDLNESGRSTRLSQYDCRSFLSIRPTDSTVQKLNGRQLLFRLTSMGFEVWVKPSKDNAEVPFIELEEGCFLTFTLEIKDPYFFNYTNLPLELMNSSFYFSNEESEILQEMGLDTLAEGSNNINQLEFVLFPKDEPIDKKKDTALVIEFKNKVKQFRSAHLGFMRIHTKNINGSGEKIPEQPSKYQLVFQNRKTFWRYIFDKKTFFNESQVSSKIKKEDDGIWITNKAYPLTHKGIIEFEFGEQLLQNPDARSLKVEATNKGRFISEIYV